MTLSRKSLDYRMYREEYPQVDELVVVQVKAIAEHGAYCSLLEYNKIEGMILMSELSRRRIRSVNRLIRVGKQEIVQVMRVHKEKGYIDLSKKRVTPEEIVEAENRWNRSKAVHSILRHVAKKCGFGVGELYEGWVWKLADNNKDAYDGLKWALNNREEFKHKYEIPKEIEGELFKQIEKRMKPQQVELVATIELTCFTKQGIIAIKKSLEKGLENNDDECVIKITYDKPPTYRLQLNTLDETKGKIRLNECINAIRKSIKQYEGVLKIGKEPYRKNKDQTMSQEVPQQNE